MKKILYISTIIVGMLVVLSNLSPAVCAEDTNTVTIEVNCYSGNKPQKIYTEMTCDQANELKEILTELNKAIETNDEATIIKCESILNEKGIFGENHQKFYSCNKYYQTMEKTGMTKYTKYFQNTSGDDISNNFCYFNAIGDGAMAWWFAEKFLEACNKAIQMQPTALGAIITYMMLFPFMVLILFLTNLVPFRILAPSGLIELQSGSMFSLGAQGFKKLVVESEVWVDLSWFTGVSINIADIIHDRPFLFVSGIGVSVEQEVSS